MCDRALLGESEKDVVLIRVGQSILCGMPNFLLIIISNSGKIHQKQKNNGYTTIRALRAYRRTLSGYKK